MAACPICHSEIEIGNQHHGTLYTCPACNAVFFVDWSGNPEAASEPTPSESQMAESLEPVVGEAYSPPIPPPSEVDIPSFDSQEADSQSSSMDFAALPADAPLATDGLPAYDFSQPMPMMGTDPTEPVMETPQSPQSMLEEITDFGNADVTQSALNYTITISGIDSAEVFAQVKEALTDSKFGWNIIQVMTQMKDGVLTIQGVNAVKASIIVQRTKYLSVNINWRQDVLSSHP